MKEKTKIKVLIDGIGGDVGQGVVKSLQSSSLNIELYGACISSKSSWLYNISNSYIFPYISDENYINFLITFLNQHKIDIYFPTIDSSLLKLAQYKQYIETKTKTIIFIDDFEKIKICDDKFLTINFLKNNGFNYPLSSELILQEKIKTFSDKTSYPFILKPKSGNGAKEIKLINQIEDLTPYIGDNRWMLQKRLDTKNEITSGIYIGDDKEVKSIYILKRELRNGSTYQAERILDTKLEEKLIAIAKKIDMKYINIQATYENGKLYPFEFNGRLSGTTGAMKQIFNVPENFILEKFFHQNIVKSTNQEKIYFSRYYEEVIYTEQEKQSLLERSYT